MRMSDFSIRMKILCGALSLVFITAVFGLLAYIFIGKVASATFSITDHYAKAVQYATGVERMSLWTVLEEKNYLLKKDDASRQRVEDRLQQLFRELDKVDALGKQFNDTALLERARKARQEAQLYMEKFRVGVESLKANKSAEESMINNGRRVEQAASRFMQLQVDAYTRIQGQDVAASMLDEYVQRYIITSNIYTLALEIMRAEKEEISRKDRSHYKNMLEMLPRLFVLYDALEKITVDKEQLQLIAGAREATRKYEQAAAGWISNDDALNGILAEMNAMGNAVIQEAQQAEETGFKQADAARTVSIELIDDSNKIILAVGVVALVFGFVVAFLLAAMISNPMKKGVRYATAVAGGDFSQTLDVHQKDEIGVLADALRSMVGTLQERIAEADRQGSAASEQARKANEAMHEAEMAGRDAKAKAENMLAAARKLEEVADVVATASSELLTHIEYSENGASEQAGRVTETVSAMEEMTSTIDEVVKSASLAADVSAQTRDKATGGETVVRKAVDSITDVQRQSMKIKEDMGILSEHAQSINQIMSVISDIADQTTLLALNAAIEAARAGEAGRGFAVVADEVRKLAEKTMASTADVDKAIRGIQQSVSMNIEQVDKAVQTISEATRYANDSGSALDEIVSMVDSFAEQVQAIAQASDAQSHSCERVSHSVKEVSSIAEETADSMRKAATAVSELSEQARVLSELIKEMQQG